jgi:hypothetical protein
LPQSSQDAGNRISFAALRGFAVTRDSDFWVTRAKSRVQCVSVDTVSMAPESASFKSAMPGNPGGRRALRAGARAGRRSIRKA